MEDNYSKILKRLPRNQPSRELLQTINLRIGLERERLVRRKLAFDSLALIFSSAASFYAFNYFSAELAKSAFPQYFSLLLSDWSLIAQYWQDFSFALVESLPALGVAALLFAVLILFGSLRDIIINLKNLKYEFR